MHPHETVLWARAGRAALFTVCTSLAAVLPSPFSPHPLCVSIFSLFFFFFWFSSFLFFFRRLPGPRRRTESGIFSLREGANRMCQACGVVNRSDAHPQSCSKVSADAAM